MKASPVFSWADNMLLMYMLFLYLVLKGTLVKLGKREVEPECDSDGAVWSTALLSIFTNKTVLYEMFKVLVY